MVVDRGKSADGIRLLCTLVNVFSLLVMAVGAVLGIVLILRRDIDLEMGVDRRQHVGAGFAVLACSWFGGLVALLNARYIEHRLTFDGADNP